MSERNLRGYIVSNLKRVGCFIHAVENPCRPGTPDVYGCIEGSMFWIELKWAEDWPKKGGKLRIKHFSREQRLWLRQHNVYGGRSFMILQVYNCWYLLSGIWAADNIDKVSQKEIHKAALVSFQGGINFIMLKTILEEHR